MKVLVTGANGFIGSHLCRFLLSQQYETYAMIRPTSDLTLLKILIPDQSQLHFVYGNVSDRTSLEKAVEGKDIIIHLAAAIRGTCLYDFQVINLLGTCNLLKACEKFRDRIQRIIFVSSMVAGGPGTPEHPQTEDSGSTPLPNDWYGVSKHQAETMIRKHFSHLPITIIRPPSVFGPGDPISLDLFKLSKRGLKMFVTQGSHPFSIVHVEDLVKGIYTCCTHPEATGQTFNFACDDTIPYADLHDLVALHVFQRSNKPLIPLAIPPKLFLFIGLITEAFGRLTHNQPYINRAKARQAAASGQVMSTIKAHQILQWKPTYSILSTLEDAGKWYCEFDWC